MRNRYLQEAPTGQGSEAAVQEVSAEDFDKALLQEPLLVADLNGDGRQERVFVRGTAILVTGADGKTLLESKAWISDRKADSLWAELAAWPDSLPLAMITTPWCLKNGPATTFLWFDTRTGQFKVTPEPVCESYSHKGNGQFEVSGGWGTALYYTDQVRWTDGQFVTDSRIYSLIPSRISKQDLEWILKLVASNQLSGEGVFATPALLQAFKAKTGPGAWAFVAETTNVDPIRYKVLLDGKPRGYLSIRTGPSKTERGPSGVPALQITELAWSE